MSFFKEQQLIDPMKRLTAMILKCAITHVMTIQPSDLSCQDRYERQIQHAGISTDPILTSHITLQRTG